MIIEKISLLSEVHISVSVGDQSNMFIALTYCGKILKVRGIWRTTFGKKD